VTQAQFKKDLADLISKHFEGATKKQANAFLTDLVAYVAKELKRRPTEKNPRAGRVNVPGLGIFSLRRRAARWGRNPQTGEKIRIKASKKIGFRPSKAFKEATGIAKPAAPAAKKKAPAKKKVARKKG
jgi:DNA-binding protein HU-beta